MSEERKRLYDLLDSIFDEADRQKSKLEEKKDKAVRYGKFVAFRLPEQIFDDVEKIADKTKKTMSEVMRDALRDFLERNKELIDEYNKLQEKESKPALDKESQEALREFLKEHRAEIEEYLKRKKEEK